MLTGNHTINRLSRSHAVQGGSIGDITDQFIFKLAPNKRDQVRAAIRDNIRKASPFFLYIFYFKTWQAQTTPIRPLPRAALYKLKVAMELFYEMSNAFKMDMVNFYVPYYIITTAIADFFQNKTKLLIVPHPTMQGAYTLEKDGAATGFATLNLITWQTTYLRKEGNNYVFDLNEENISHFFSACMRHKTGGKEVYKYLEMLPLLNSQFIEFQKDNGAPAHLQTPEGVIKNAFEKSVSDNAWVTGYYTARTDKGNLVVFCLADDFQKMKFAEMFPPGSYVHVDLRFYTGDSAIAQIRGVQRVVKNLKQGNAIAIEFDVQVPGNSQNVLAGIYRLPPVFSSLASAQDYVTKTKRSAQVAPAKVGAIDVLPNGSYQITTGSLTTMLPIPLPGGSLVNNIFDPDGLPLPGTSAGQSAYKAFAIPTKTAYVSGRKNSIGLFGVDDALAAVIITAIVTITTTLASILAAVFTKMPSLGDTPGGGDFRYDPNNCKWHDQAKGILTCPLLDGSGWVLVDQGTGEVIAQDPDGGQGNSGGGTMQAGFGYLAAAAMLFFVIPKGKTNKRSQRRA